MAHTIDAEHPSLDEKLADIEHHLRGIRQDVSLILRSVRDELEAFREREFWRDYGDSYQQD